MSHNTIPLLQQRIDWALLREQKFFLLDLTDEVDGKERELLEGVVSLIDAIQDAAVDEGIATELEVFGDPDDPT